MTIHAVAPLFGRRVGREKGLIGTHDKTMRIRNWSGLVEEAKFDATCLHLEPAMNDNVAAFHGHQKR